MNEDLVYFLSKETIKVAALVAAPLLVSSLVIGLVVSIFQAITQINEATLTFIPKILSEISISLTLLSFRFINFFFIFNSFLQSLLCKLLNFFYLELIP